MDECELTGWPDDLLPGWPADVGRWPPDVGRWPDDLLASWLLAGGVRAPSPPPFTSDNHYYR